MIRFASALVVGLALLAGACGDGGSSTPNGPTPLTPASSLPVPRVLTIGTVGAGSGTITSTDNTIQCGEFCKATYLAIATVTLTAQADPGFMFAGFEGDPDCTDGTVTMSGDVSCVARFDVPRVLRVTITGAGSGRVTSPDSTIDCGVTCDETFLITKTVTLVAVPDAGSLLAGFGGDPDCADGSVSTSVDLSCTARFEPTSTLSATSFLTFGDSLTFGFISVPSPAGLRLVGTPDSYPTRLEALLSASYPFQAIAMDNRGVSGELTQDGVLRLPGLLASVGPTVDAFLLIHGVNDLERLRQPGIPAIAANVDSMVQQAQMAGLTVFLGTLPPEDAPRQQELRQLVPLLNQEYARIAATRGVTLVDLFAGMNLSLIGPDGLHPNAAGYQRIAEIFFSAITALFDMPFSPTSLAPSPTGAAASDPAGAGGPLRMRRRPLPRQLRGGR